MNIFQKDYILKNDKKKLIEIEIEHQNILFVIQYFICNNNFIIYARNHEMSHYICKNLSFLSEIWK